MQKFTYVLSNKRPPSLLTFKLFVGPQLPSYDPQYLSPSKLTAYFFPEYLSNEIVIVSSIFFVKYELERFYTQIRMSLVINLIVIIVIVFRF